MITYYNQGKLWKKEFVWAYSSGRREKSLMTVRHGSRQQAWWQEEEAGRSKLKHKYKAKIANWTARL